MKPLDNLTNGASPDECAGLIADIVPLVMRAIRQEISHHRPPDISLPQFRSLAFLRRHEGASLTDLSSHLGLTLPTSSKMIDGLVKREMIVREIYPDDRRRVTLTLTGRGRDAFQSARLATQKKIAGMLTKLSEDDRASIAQAMKALRPVFTSEAVNDPANR